MGKVLFSSQNKPTRINITAIYQDVDTIYSGTETVNVISKKYKLKTERKTLK